MLAGICYPLNEAQHASWPCMQFIPCIKMVACIVAPGYICNVEQSVFAIYIYVCIDLFKITLNSKILAVPILPITRAHMHMKYNLNS